MSLFKIKPVGDGRLKVYFLGIQVFVSSPMAVVSTADYPGYNTEMFKQLEEVGRHIDDCKHIMTLFCDEESRDAYQCELMFMFLSKICSRDIAVQYAANMSQEEWYAACAETRALLLKGGLPKIKTNLSKQHASVVYLFTTTFVLEQYHYKDMVTIQEGDVVLDCGGCYGETSVWALQKGASKVYTFEPSPETIPYIKANIETFGKDKRMVLVPYALGAMAGTISFMVDPENFGASSVQASDQEGIVSVSQITLDDWCTENNIIPDFIKMDIEGAEVDAIKGARHIIANYKPRLAICLYHRISDMWVIPAMLKELCPAYRFWCKKNALNDEFVLYASV